MVEVLILKRMGGERQLIGQGKVGVHFGNGSLVPDERFGHEAEFTERAMKGLRAI